MQRNSLLLRRSLSNNTLKKVHQKGFLKQDARISQGALFYFNGKSLTTQHALLCNNLSSDKKKVIQHEYPIKNLLINKNCVLENISTFQNSSSRSFSTSVLIMQNQDTSKTMDGFTNMMNTLFVKAKPEEVNELNLSMRCYDLDSDEFIDPKQDPDNKTFTENSALAYHSTGSGLVDFFYFTVQGVTQTQIHKLLDASWEVEALKTLKVIFFIRDIDRGKGENQIFYETQRWLALKHPQTFLENLKHIPKSGYWKDLQNILLYIKYGGHELDERPNPKYNNDESDSLLRRLPSAKALYDERVFELRRYCRRSIRGVTNEQVQLRKKTLAEGIEAINKQFQEESFLKTQWDKSRSASGKLDLTREQNTKLKSVFEKAKAVVVDLYVEQLQQDSELFNNGKSISLCAKWAPTINLSADRDLGIGRKIAQKLFPFEKPGGIFLTKRKEGLGNKLFNDQQVYRYLANIKYQKLLRDLRKATCTVETLMSAKEWSKIPYERVPSVCMKKNKKLFSKRDKSRFTDFLASVTKGDAKINGKAVFPHTLTEELLNVPCLPQEMVDTIELQWNEIVKNVKEKANYGLFNCIPVCDVSGSMDGTPLNVATALSLIMSEVNTGIFKDKIITFSSNPSFVDLKGIGGLSTRLRVLKRSDWGMNTNYLATFDLILRHAVENNLPKDQMLKKIVVFSDMQFDASKSPDEGSSGLTSHEQIVKKFAEHGYQAPSIVYWNLNGSYNNSPITYNTDGVACISGFNATLLRMVAEEKIDVMSLVDKAIAKGYDHVKLFD